MSSNESSLSVSYLANINPAVAPLEPAVNSEVPLPPLPPIPHPVTINEKSKTAIEHVKLSRLVLGDYSFRQSSPEQLPEGLIASMKRYGFLGGLIGTRRSSKIQLAYGRKRVLAAQVAGLEAVPVHIYDLSDDDLYWLALEEAFLQSNLSPLEEALAIKDALNRYSVTLEHLAERLACEVSRLSARLALVKYAEVETALRKNVIDAEAAYQLTQIEDAAIRNRFLRQWQATSATASRILIVPMEVPYNSLVEETSPVAEDDILTEEVEPSLKDVYNLISSFGQQLKEFDLSRLSRDPEWRKPTRKALKALIEQLQETEKLFKNL